jgi:hypothetical protein
MNVAAVIEERNAPSPNDDSHGEDFAATIVAAIRVSGQP